MTVVRIFVAVVRMFATIGRIFVTVARIFVTVVRIFVTVVNSCALAGGVQRSGLQVVGVSPGHLPESNTWFYGTKTTHFRNQEK